MNALVTACGLALPGRLEASDLTLESGRLYCLIGPNGSGKTSLLHALARIGHPSGTIRIGGADPWTAPPAQRRRLLSYLPATRDMIWPLTAGDVVALSGADPVPALAMLELSDMADRRLDRMSTGERSRVLIARVIASEPLLLLLDEPVANLDPLWQLRLMELLGSLARQKGRSVLVAIHDLELAGIYADRLIVMDRGRIAAEGEPEALLAGQLVPAIFGIERENGRWRPVRTPQHRRSSP